LHTGVECAMPKVVLENVHVDFPICGTQQFSLRSAIYQRATGGLIRREGRNQDRIVVQSLTEISITLEDGDRLALIGHNGSGMTTRLGFSLVTALDPDVLLMDEGFGAADLSFAERAAKRMSDFIGRSRIMVLASHSHSLIKSFCNKAALMKEGRILATGPVQDILDHYQVMVTDKKA